MQGAPGTGKTMFSFEVCRRWGQNKLIQQYFLLVMLCLEDSSIQNVQSIEDLFLHAHVTAQHEVAAEVLKLDGKGVLFLLDGFDKLPKNQRAASSFWMRLITGKFLRLATVMVTSRPCAITTLGPTVQFLHF